MPQSTNHDFDIHDASPIDLGPLFGAKLNDLAHPFKSLSPHAETRQHGEQDDKAKQVLLPDPENETSKKELLNPSIKAALTSAIDQAFQGKVTFVDDSQKDPGNVSFSAVPQQTDATSPGSPCSGRRTGVPAPRYAKLEKRGLRTPSWRSTGFLLLVAAIIAILHQVRKYQMQSTASSESKAIVRGRATSSPIPPNSSDHAGTLMAFHSGLVQEVASAQKDLQAGLKMLQDAAQDAQKVGAVGELAFKIMDTHASAVLAEPLQGETGNGTKAHHRPGSGPAWTRGEVEKPLGTGSMGTWTKAFYTKEQQVRLGVDDLGIKVSANPQLHEPPAIANQTRHGMLAHVTMQNATQQPTISSITPVQEHKP